MIWWAWLLLGMFLLLVEMITPGGFYFLFFAVAALIVGMLAAFGVGPDWLLVGLFSGLSIGSLVLFRGPLLRRLKRAKGPEHPVDSMTGEVVTLVEDLPGQAVGQAMMRGTIWTVKNTRADRLPKGQRCRIERVEGLTLLIVPE